MSEDEEFFNLEDDEKTLFESIGAFDGRFNTSLVTDEGIYLKRWGDRIEIPYEDLECLQYNYAYMPEYARYDWGEGHRVYIYSKDNKRQNIACDETLPGKIAENAIPKRAKALETIRKGRKSDLKKELISAINDEDFADVMLDTSNKTKHLYMKRGFIDSVGEILKDFNPHRIRGKYLGRDPILVFDKWIVGAESSHLSLINRSNVYFTIFRRDFEVKEKIIQKSRGPLKGSAGCGARYETKEKGNKLHLYTQSGSSRSKHTFKDVRYESVKGLLDSMNPYYESLRKE